jgi:hypothetical protein
MNIEMVTRLTKIGGNGSILSYALAHFGIQVSYIGSLGWPKPHPVFDDFAKRVKTLLHRRAGLLGGDRIHRWQVNLRQTAICKRDLLAVHSKWIVARCTIRIS